MSTSTHTARLFVCLCVFGTLVNATHGAEAPVSAKTYAFELRTLNLGDQVRRGGLKFNIADGMTEDELDAVKHVLDEAGAPPVDADGYRELSLSNGTRVRIGGFLVEGFVEDSVEGVQHLPVELSMQGEFSTPEASLVLRIMNAGSLFIGSSDSDRVATSAKVTDKRFYRLHKNASIAPDEAALVGWVRQNIPAR